MTLLYSYSLNETSGILHSSILVPVIFLLNINDISDKNDISNSCNEFRLSRWILMSQIDSKLSVDRIHVQSKRGWLHNSL